MLSREKRLRSDKDIQLVFKKGRSIFDKVCGIKFVKNNKDFSRFTIVVGTKIDKRAVVRNRLKRQYRSVVAGLLNDLKPGFDIVLLPSKDAIGVDFNDKKKKLLKVFEKGNLC